jgi:hypothetical protein
MRKKIKNWAAAAKSRPQNSNSEKARNHESAV